MFQFYTKQPPVILWKNFGQLLAFVQPFGIHWATSCDLKTFVQLLKPDILYGHVILIEENRAKDIEGLNSSIF
jgi:hypothetical protein